VSIQQLELKFRLKQLRNSESNLKGQSMMLQIKTEASREHPYHRVATICPHTDTSIARNSTGTASTTAPIAMSALPPRVELPWASRPPPRGACLGGASASRGMARCCRAGVTWTAATTGTRVGARPVLPHRRQPPDDRLFFFLILFFSRNAGGDGKDLAVAATSWVVYWFGRGTP
jgi:hypothetical protein